MLNSISSAYKRYRRRYPVYVFHHMPKCGGTSVRVILDEWFHVYDDYFDIETREKVEPVALKFLNSEKCLVGHFGHDGYRLEQRYPEIFSDHNAHNRYRVFSFLRDPLQMRCSLFRHKRRNNQISTQTLAQSIMTHNNYFARIMGLNENDYREKLDRYFFIGLQEEMQASVDLLASIIGKPKVNIPVSNVTVRSSENRADALSSKEISEFKKENQLDYLIYDYVREGLERGSDNCSEVC